MSNIATAEVLPVTTATIDTRETLTVNGRALHAFLGVKRDFSTWMKDRIDKFEFVENQDFIIFTNFGENSGRGRKTIDYILSIDMAKQLSMVENSETGRQTRKYFIACERRAMEAAEAARSQFTLTGDGPRALDGPSDVKSRRPLTNLINTWVSLAPISYRDAWHQVKGHFQVEKAENLTVHQVHEACAWVQERIDRLTLPPQVEAPKPLLALPDGMTIELPDLEQVRKDRKKILDAAHVTQDLLRSFFVDHNKFMENLSSAMFAAYSPEVHNLYHSLDVFGVYIHTLSGTYSLIHDMVDRVMAGYELVAALQQGRA